jgi:hypothetical protein
MKNRILFLLQLVLISFSGKLVAQAMPDPTAPILSPNGMYDRVYDRYGNQFSLANLSVNSSKPIGGGSGTQVIASTCTAGKFTLHFEQGSIFDNSVSMRTITCKVYTDISSFITSTISNGAIQIHCRDAVGGLGFGSPFYVFPSFPANPNPGIVDGQVYKALISGTDPYLSLPLLFYNSGGSGNFYHGYVEANSTVTWNYNLGTTTINPGEYDAYSTMLHEAMHSLGIHTAITHTNGASMFNSALAINSNMVDNNYYTRYDQFLFDLNGNPLLASSNTLCPTSSLTFAPLSPTVISVNQNTTNVVQDITNCNTAVQYSGSVNFSVYTPNSLEPGSSFAHFEDYCSHPSGTTVCTGTVGNWNNLYFLMANFTPTGSCYVKRHLADEERKVLCDLGYSVAGSFGTSSVAGSSYTYSGGACSPSLTIYGNNDGLAGNVYTLVTTIGSTTIPYSTLLNNDFPVSGLTVSCLELVYNNATLTPGASDFTVQAAPGSGVVTLKYFPKDIGSGKFGNATYVFIYFVPPGCLSCGIVNNAGFEYSQNSPTISACGQIGSIRKLDCWEPYIGNAEYLFATTCTGTSYELGVNTMGTSPPVNTLNIGAATNNQCVGLIYSNSSVIGALKNNLNTQLVNTNTYQVSFWLINQGSTNTNTTINTPGNSIILTLASHTAAAFTPTVNFPTGLSSNILSQFTINPSNVWSLITHTFVYTGSAPAQAVIFGIDALQTTPPVTSGPGAYQYWCFIDEFSIVPYPAVNFSIQSSALCTNQGIADLGQFTGTTTGSFSGPGVTYNSISGKYDFNAAGFITPGVYPVAFTYTNSPNTCLNTIYQSIAVINCCASPSISSMTATTYTGSTGIQGPKLFPNSFTIQPSSQVLLSGEFLISAGVKITVSSTGTLDILGAHLYGCLAMWQGIEVLDGGMVRSVSAYGHENLIEDAEIAIDVSNYNPNSANDFIELKDVTFNKNYIGINLVNYPITTNTSVPISLRNCVFTCRNFTFSSSSWSSASNLRTATNPTTGLAPPYTLQGAPIATLKSPHASVPSHIAINILNSGSTATLYPASSIFSFNSIYIGPAPGGVATNNFILFDTHENFINSSASNVRIENCVFQNTQTLTANPVGAAIQFTSNLTNNKLDVSGASSALGCRFYDCHTAIDIKNAYSINVENSIIRSAHSILAPTTAGTNLPGDRGIHILTNRFEDYIIQNNELTNVTDAVSMACVTGNFVGGPGWFEPFTYSPNIYYWNIMYARNVSVTNNTISPQTSTSFSGSTNNYVYNPITIVGPVNIWSTYAAAGISVLDNKIYRTYNGVTITGLNSIGIGYHADGPPKMIRSNSIQLEDVSTATVQQVGIEYSASIPAPSGFPTFSNQVLQSIETNTLSVYNSPLTNTNVMLIHAAGNGAGGSVVPSPYVICNNLSNAYQGFVFNGNDNPTYWRGNSMDNLAQGMSLVNSGSIGVQGTSSSSSDNIWLGSWSSYSNTFVDGSSDAVNSPLFVQSGSTTYPPFNNGPNPVKTYNQVGNITIVGPGASTYVCGGSYNQLITPLPEGDPNADIYSYMSHLQTFRFLHYHQSLLGDAGSEPRIFLESLEGTSISKFTEIEDTLGWGNISAASSILTGIDPEDFTNVVESNYYAFYNLYIQHMSGIDFTNGDMQDLIELASLCPGTNGSSVYQARALYLMLTGKVFNATYPCIEREGSRPGSIIENKQIKKLWDVGLFPNPTTGKISIVSKTENENLNIQIRDLLGREVFVSLLNSNGLLAELDLKLIDGAYFISIRNQRNEIITKKLLVAK